jgi:hypothetical protein
MNNLAKKNTRKSLVILIQRQFGGHVGTYFYCRYLRDQFNITVICWDYSLEKQAVEGIDVVYISREGNILYRNLRYISSVYNWLKSNTCDICFITYFRGCSILKVLLPNMKFVFDIRTASVNKKLYIRTIYNQFMMFESLFFRHLTVISESLAVKLKISKKAHILPLGSESISKSHKQYDALRLLYVGTLHARDIDTTLIAFSKFYHDNKNMISMEYTIIGDGPEGEVEQLRDIVNKNLLSDVVRIEGSIPFTELKPYFDTHNVGVSFVPLTDYFDFQPVTKTFDYLLSGLSVIATATSENKKVITELNGVLIDDTQDDFYRGLEAIWKNKEIFNSERIVSMSVQYNWSDIVNKLGDYLTKVSVP